MHEIRIERTFHASHALRFPDGTSEPLHAHDWRTRVHVAAERLDGLECVMDFHLLEQIVEGVLARLQDRNLNELAPFEQVNPSAERVAEHIFRQIEPQLEQRVRLRRVSVTEAEGCVATFEA